MRPVDYLRIRRADPGQRGVFIRSMPPLRALHGAGITAVVSKHARLAGLQGVYAHRLRHTAACQVLAGGGNIRQVQELLGHASLASVDDLCARGHRIVARVGSVVGRLP